jgi:hypothetical protein
MSHPYRNKEDYCFWNKAMSSPHPGHIDPVTKAELIEPEAKVATMGSCFAQHIARHLQKSGLNYFVSEVAPEGLSASDATKYNFGIFSARYGNVYTVRQALQLFERAFGNFHPAEFAWQRKDGRWVDAFRPQIDPDGFESADAVQASAKNHLVHVREVFTRSDWLVITLGLTEAWRSRKDGAIYPLAPGVAGGAFNHDLHEFVNFTLDEVWEDLDSLMQKALAVNPKLKFLLTVSPVALLATYESRHVLSSTVCSKSILRVAADLAERKYSQAIYFPSYEIITSPAHEGRYFEDDFRQVTELGVSHVMRIFSKHFIEGNHSVATPTLDLSLSNTDVVCDEEAILLAIKNSGINT